MSLVDREIAYTRVIDPRIDVGAQRAILRMSKGDPAARADAEGMLRAVKRGELQGIYGDDLRAAATIARRLGTVRWELVPRGRDAVLVRPPGERPAIVFREQARSVPPRLDPALRAAYAGLRDRPLVRPPVLVRRGDRLVWVTPPDGETPAFTLARFPPAPAFTTPIRITDPGALPNRLSCWVETTFAFTAGLTNRTMAGSGFLVGPRHVLTAGHVLLTRASVLSRMASGVVPGESVRVVPGRDGTGTGGLRDALHWRVAPGWLRSCAGDSGADVGLITLAGPADVAGFWGAAGTNTVLRGVDPGTPAKGTRIVAVGYPGSGCGVSVPGGTCAGPGTFLYQSAGDVIELTGTAFTSTMPTESGLSGSPVWTNERGVRRLVGIHVTGDRSGPAMTNVAGAVRYTPALHALVRKWVAEDARLFAGRKQALSDVVGTDTGSGCRPSIRFD